MKPYPGSVVTVELMIAGYQAALDRFATAEKDREAEPALIAIFDALNWAVAIDDRVGETWRPAGVKLKQAWRDEVPGARILDGIRLVRNSVHHDWAEALERVDGMPFPLKFRLPFHEWRWRPVDALPEPDPTKMNPAVLEGQRERYRAGLAGHSASTTLRQLDPIFAYVLRLLEPKMATPGHAAPEL
jgi:hypothetical protein